MGGNIILFWIRFQRNVLIFLAFLKSLSELHNIFHVKGLKIFTFNVKLIDTIGERPNKKKIESLDLTQEVFF